MKTLRTILHTYAFDTDKPAEAAEWAKLKAKLKSGPSCMESHGGPLHVQAAATLGAKHTSAAYESIPVELDTDFLSNNQWNATGPNGKSCRVFDWALDSAYAFDPHGRSMRKQGHWLEQTPEVVAIRQDTFTCGYCGHKEHRDTAEAFCKKCTTKGSEYLKPDDLRLTRMLPVCDSFGAKRAPLTDAERAELMPLYVAAQLSRPDPGRSFADIAEGKALAHKAIARASMLLNGWQYLEAHPEIPTRNLICYDHGAAVALFTWGWQGDGMALEVATELAARLKDFPASWEIVTGKGKDDRITGGAKVGMVKYLADGLEGS